MKADAIFIIPSTMSYGESLKILLVPHRITILLNDDNIGRFIDLQRTF